MGGREGVEFPGVAYSHEEEKGSKKKIFCISLYLPQSTGELREKLGQMKLL